MSNITQRLQGQVGIVTGAGRGIGAAVAARLAGLGAIVVLCGRSRSRLESTAEALSRAGQHSDVFECDVTSLVSVERLARHVETSFGRVDILVNNAGVTRDGLAMRMSLEDWDSVINTNLRGAFSFVQAIIRAMIKQRGGRIINISSVVGLMGNAGQTNYAASKAGLIGFTKSLARELASRNITVNTVAPGFITTEMTAGLSDEIKNSIQSKIPLGKTGNAEDVANAVGFLASTEAGYITGQVLCVDGGIVM